MLGDEFEVAQQLLRPTDYRAEVYPCTNPGGHGCPRRVVDLGERGLYAVCGDVDRLCPDILLKPADLVVYELDRQRFGVMVAVALGVTPVSYAPVAHMRETCRIGEYNPRAGDRFPVFLTIQWDRLRLRDILTRLLRMESTPFIVVLPTDYLVDLDVRELFTGKKARICALEDILGVEEPERLVPTPAATRMLEEFHAGVFPDEGGPGAMELFPTPPDARWNELKIRFLTRDTVSIQCRGIIRSSTYLHMKMADGRTGQPNRQWLLLFDMADWHGRKDIHGRHVSEKDRKCKETLSRSLQSYFGIADDPISWNDDAYSYVTRFVLEP